MSALHSAANIIASPDCMSAFVTSGISVDVVKQNISNVPSRNLKIRKLCWSTFHSVVCTVHASQVTMCKLVQHCAHTYTVKLNSDMFRWRPPTIIREDNASDNTWEV